MYRPTAVTLITIVLFGVVAAPAQAADPTDKCHYGKLKESAKYASCRLKAEAKAVLLGGSPEFGRCTSKFPSKFDNIEANAGIGVCPSEGDGPSIDGWLTRDTSDIATLLAGGTISRVPASGQTTSYGSGDDGDIEPGEALQYVDNGDGTITDTNTGLMWEKKILGTDGYTPCNDETGTCANPHHADNAYSWEAMIPLAYDGTVVTIFLEQLNDRCSDDTTVACTVDADCAVPGGPCGFAGYRDWRLPSHKELFSIVDAGVYAPCVATAFNGASCGPGCADITTPACSCSALAAQWSSTTYVGDPTRAWYVDFFTGDVQYAAKVTPLYTRAVRGGS